MAKRVAFSIISFLWPIPKLNVFCVKINNKRAMDETYSFSHKYIKSKKTQDITAKRKL